jgi:pyridoxal phosphate enzyme (YggS family)
MDEARNFADRLQSVMERIVAAAARSGRSGDSVRLMAITKGFSAETVRAAMDLGLRDFGENRVQEAETKIASVAPRPRWHLVGHLQGNKARRAVQLFDSIHSLDSEPLAHEVSRRATEAGKRIPCLVEVNTSGEAAKFGIPPGDLIELLRAVRGLTGITLDGLMTIGPLQGGPEGARRAFRMLAALRAEAQGAGLLAPGAQLSMGMSEDFEVAIEEGATIVRIGTGLFGLRQT